MPEIAVVIPTYNRARFLPAALDSVLAQDLDAPIEVAVVDDGSTDGTEVVVRPYLDRTSPAAAKVQIRYIKLPRQGVVAARNAGLRETTAPWVAFLDSDDFWDPAKLRRQLEGLGKDPEAGTCHTSFRFVNDQGEPADDGPQRLDNPCRGDCLKTLLREDVVIFSSVMARRDLIDEAARVEAHGLPFDPRWTNAQDYDLLLRLARLAPFAYVAEPLTLYRRHDGHAAMGDLKRAFGFHARVQIDFVRRFGNTLGLGQPDADVLVANFLHGRAESLFWQRHLGQARSLCDLAGEMGLVDERFPRLRGRCRWPTALYRVKDRLDRIRRAAADRDGDFRPPRHS